MSLTYLAPAWFFGYDVLLEIIFATITLTISLYAFKIYKASNQKQIKLFGISFFFISLSYVTQSFFNYLIISKMNENMCRALKIQTIALFDSIGLYAHILFMIMGLIVLTYMTFKIKKIRILILMIIITLTGIFSSNKPTYMFYLFSTIYLTFLLWHFTINYLEKKQIKTLLITIAFLFMLFGKIHFLIAINHQTFYVIGHFIELIVYLLIFFNFYLVRKK